MKRVILSIAIIASIVAIASCARVRQWNEKQREKVRKIYPYRTLVSEGILPPELDRQAQRAFYECFANQVNNTYPSTTAFVNFIIFGISFKIPLPHPLPAIFLTGHPQFISMKSGLFCSAI